MKQPFNPNLLPISLKDEDVIKLLHLENNAIKKIERCNTLMERSIVKNQLMSMFTLNESVQSTKIEGTQATISEVIESDVTGNVNQDIIEVKNYQFALKKGKDLLKSIPISTRMFHELHAILLHEARGSNRGPGEYRKTQNFIGPTSRIEDATYIPPESSKINLLMSNLEKYINDEIEDNLGVLSKAAVIHAQFETIHPYYDGNGRVGRILIVLFLLSQNVINSTNFFLSRELERNKYQYYALLNGVRNDNNPKWQNWIEFFIISAEKQADYYIQKMAEIEIAIGRLLLEAKSNKIKDDYILAICNKPIFTINYIKNFVGVSYETARKNIQKLVELNYIYPDDKRRNKVYRYYELLDILRD